MPRSAMVLAMLAALGTPARAAAAVAPAKAAVAATPADASPPTPTRFTRSRYTWSRCAADGQPPCARPRPARLLLLSLGALAGGAAAGILFALGDRLAPSDPATLFVGAGGLAGVGAIVGMVLGHVGGDRAARPDRVRTATGELTYGLATPSQLDERSGHTMALRFAPTWNFRDGMGRVRLVGHVGGLLAPTKDVDPRPQSAMLIDGQAGTAPVALRRRMTSFGLGLDWAVRLPYPVLPSHRTEFLGPAEIRWKPDVQIRRDVVDAGRPQQHIVSRTMLLPLTVGMRWHLSPRQRFTFYVGPRFDFVAASPYGSATLRRSGAQLGPLYGEAWYDLDVPLTAAPRRNGHARRTESNGQLSLGYTHTRFDGQGFNVGPVIGFLGPFHAQWHTRIRPVGAPVALQATAAVAVGNGLLMTASVGIVAPDLSQLSRRRREGMR